MESNRKSRPIQEDSRTSGPIHPRALRCRICDRRFPSRRGEPFGADSDRVLDHIERDHPTEMLPALQEYEELRRQEAGDK